MSKPLTKEEIMSIVFNKHEWRMADFPFGDDKEAVLESMSEYAKQEAIAFYTWMWKFEISSHFENGKITGIENIGEGDCAEISVFVKTLNVYGIG